MARWTRRSRRSPSALRRPIRSRPSSTASASTPPTATQTMCGARSDGSPSCSTPSTDTAATRSASVSRRAVAASRLQLARLRERRRRGAEADDAEHVLEAAPSGALLRAADDERLEADAPTNDEGTDAGWASELVGADRDEVGAERIEVQRDVAGGRGRVDVHRHAGGPAALHDLRNGLQGPDFVVAPLTVHECRPARRGRRRAVSRDGRGRSGRPSPRAEHRTGPERSAGLPDAGVLDVGADNRARRAGRGRPRRWPRWPLRCRRS